MNMLLELESLTREDVYTVHETATGDIHYTVKDSEVTIHIYNHNFQFHVMECYATERFNYKFDTIRQVAKLINQVVEFYE